MKANELRLGNYVFTKSETIEQVSEINETLISIKTRHGKTVGGFDITLFKPIPLTEEWLVKFGLKQVTYDKKRFYFLGTDIYIFDESKIYFNADSSNLSVKLEHVHQLQNLYFTLTGEELTIKEL